MLSNATEFVPCRRASQTAVKAIDYISSGLKRGKLEVIEWLDHYVTVAYEKIVKGPKAAIDMLKLEKATPDERARWQEEARIRTILGSSAKSLTSLKSGIRCWFKFKSKDAALHACEMWAQPKFAIQTGQLKPMDEAFLPPTCSELLAYSVNFRSAGTWANYLNYAKTACMLAEVDTRAR